MNTFYITTPIYYANSYPHLGHLYTTIVADTIRRYKRQRGFDTYFLTGTDEHGVNIERAAALNGRTPQQHVDEISTALRETFADFELDEAHGGYDYFMRTTSAFHYEGVAKLWRAATAGVTPKGNSPIYKGFYEGWFCAACAAFKTEDEYKRPQTEGGAPTCLVHESELDRVAEESYFFRLSDYGDALLALYEKRPDFVRPESRRNEVISFVKNGLQDLSISRLQSSVGWGIPVPDDPAHTMFVWFDALSNYITAIGYGNDERERAVGFARYWPALHLIGKDILRQHAIYWPCFLLAAGVELPAGIFSHGLLLDQQGRKMSKTIGNVVDLDVLRKYFAPEVVRYFCLREVSFGQDGKIGYEALIERGNSDLASGLGNLASRTFTMLQKYCAQTIPADAIPDEMFLAAKRAGLDPDPQALASAFELARDQYLTAFDDLNISRGLEAIWTISARIDKFISDAKPWVLAQTPGHEPLLHAVLYRAAEALRWLAVLLQPALPRTSSHIYKLLGFSSGVADFDPRELKWGGLVAGAKTGAPEPLFPRFDKGKIMGEINQMQPESDIATVVSSVLTEPQAAAPDSSNLIDIEDFAKIELRAGQVVSAERVPKADKLLLLKVDLGEAEPRQILAGLAEYYEPESMVGRKVVVVANLKPRKLRGFESQGMICAASVGDGDKPVLATFAEDVKNGARLR